MTDKDYIDIAARKIRKEEIKKAAMLLSGEQYAIKAQNINHALILTLENILQHGKSVMIKENNLLEISPFTVHITNPKDNMPLLAHRLNNPFACIAETLWVIAGRSDIEFLSHYLPRAVDYSDDGISWRGGYGPRLRHYGSHQGREGIVDSIDQIKHIINVLKKDIHSRQAVIMIYDPTVDHEQIGISKDIPCNNWIQFIVREGKLNCYTSVRSNDMMWGFSGINVFEWTTIQSLIAFNLGVQMGDYYHFVGSAHLYERHWDRARKIIRPFIDSSNVGPKTSLCNIDFVQMNYQIDELYDKLDYFFEIHNDIVEGKAKIVNSDYKNGIKHQYFSLLHLYNSFIREDYNNMKFILDILPTTNLKICCIHYLLRKAKGLAVKELNEVIKYEEIKYLKNRGLCKEIDPITGGLKWL